MDKLLAARRFLSEGLPGEPVYGFVPDAGLPKTFRPAKAPSALGEGGERVVS